MSQGGLYVDIMDLVLCCYSGAVETPCPQACISVWPSCYVSYREALGDLTTMTSDSDSDGDSDISEGK